MTPRRLVVQIPAWNEAETLPLPLADPPRRKPGCESVSWRFGSPWVYAGRTGLSILRLWPTA